MVLIPKVNENMDFLIYTENLVGQGIVEAGFNGCCMGKNRPKMKRWGEY